jgi:hypothetical protein
MSQVVFEKMLRRFMSVYGKPNTPDEEGFYAEYAKALSGWSGKFLDLATDALIREHTSSFWPTVGECTKVLRRVAAEQAALVPRQRKPEDDLPKDFKPDPEMAAKVEAIMKEFFSFAPEPSGAAALDIDVSRNGFAERAAQGRTRFAP